MKSDQVVETAITLLQREIVLPRLVWTNGVGGWEGRRNDTITVRIPPSAVGRERALRSADTIQVDPMDEDSIAVKIDTQLYHGTPVTLEELTLDIRDYTTQKIVPQVRAVTELYENKVADLIESAAYQTTHVVDPDDPFPAFVDADLQLNDDNVPSGERTFVVGPRLYAAILKSPQFKHYDLNGNDDALRRAMVGQLAGYNLIRSNALTDKDSGYVFHKTAFVVGNRAPAVPLSAPAGGTVASSDGHFALTWIRDYDFTQQIERSVFSTFYGGNVVTDGGVFKRGAKISLNPGS
ncbi:P22 phage major capsid protein family protein [Tsukamurella tyrosinosolvens]|uniref:P22 phage major capsid protein family protein n=1 Tax=Tsukamurella tyrosinosolvens TaxID=57704 RepID=UPI003462C109